MANWKKLNKEFETVINKITDAEWDNWIKNIDEQKNNEKIKMLIEAYIQAKKNNI